MGLGALTLAAVAYRSGASRERSPCQAAADEMNAVWSTERSKQLRTAILATELPHAEDTWDRVSQQVEGYARDWQQQSVQACEATHIEQTQSPELLERRRRCLGERLHRLDGFLDVLAEPEPAVVDHAVQGVRSLPDLQGCADVAALQAGVPPPEQESTRLLVAELRDSLAHLEALSAGGRYQEQVDQLEPMLEQARATGYLPIVASVEHALARAQQSLDLPEGMTTLRGAFRDALAAADDRRAAMVAVDLGHGYGYQQRLHDRGREWVDIAQSLVHRIGGSPKLEVGMTNTLAIIAIRQARYDEALALFERLVEEQRAIDPQSPNLVVTLMNLGSAYAERRELDKAREYLEQALELTEQILGPKHPSNTTIYANLALISVIQGRFDQAEKELHDTLALQREVLGPDHLEYVRSLASMAVVQRNLGRIDESERLHRQALAVRRKKLGPDHPEVAESIRNLALTVADQQRPQEALELAREAQAIAQKRLEDDHPEHGTNATIVARMLVELGQAQEAKQEAELAIKILERRGPDPTASLAARTIKGRAERELGQLEASRSTLELTVRLAQDGDVGGGKLGLARFELAQTLAATGDDIQARELTTLARTSFQKAGAGYRRDLERLEQWMATAP